MEVTAIRLRSQGDSLSPKGSGSLAVHLEFLGSDIPPVPLRVFRRKGQAGILPGGMEQPIRRDVGSLHLDAAIPGHSEISGSFHIPGGLHIDFGMASHRSQGRIVVPGIGGLPELPQFHVSPGIDRDGGIRGRIWKTGSGHDQTVLGSHIAPGVESHLGIGFRSLRVPDGQVVPGNSDGVQFGFSRGRILDSADPEFIDGDVSPIDVADVHGAGIGHSQGLDVQVPCHIPGPQAEGTAPCCIDALAAGDGKVLPVQVHRSSGTLSPRLHRIDGHCRKVLCVCVPGMDDTSGGKSTGKGNVFPQDGASPPLLPP